MSLEAQRIAEAGEMDPRNRRAKSERRGKDRRLPETRINRAAPRHSFMKAFGAWATGMSVAIFVIVFLATMMVLQATPWIALAVSGSAVVVSVFCLLLGCIEQRLIEIRLELMMANGGMRQSDRRSGERRTDAARVGDPINAPAAKPVALKSVIRREAGQSA